MSNNRKAIQNWKKKEHRRKNNRYKLRVKHFKWEVDSGNKIFKRIGQSYFMNYSFNREQNTNTSCTQHVRLQRIRSRSVSPQQICTSQLLISLVCTFFVCCCFHFNFLLWLGKVFFCVCVRKYCGDLFRTVLFERKDQ